MVMSFVLGHGCCYEENEQCYVEQCNVFVLDMGWDGVRTCRPNGGIVWMISEQVSGRVDTPIDQLVSQLGRSLSQSVEEESDLGHVTMSEWE